MISHRLGKEHQGGESARLMSKSKAPACRSGRQTGAKLGFCKPSVLLCAGADGRRFIRRHRLLFAVCFGLLRLAALADVDTTFEERSVFDGNTRGNDVAGEGTVAADIDA